MLIFCCWLIFLGVRSRKCIVIVVLGFGFY